MQRFTVFATTAAGIATRIASRAATRSALRIAMQCAALTLAGAGVAYAATATPVANTGYAAGYNPGANAGAGVQRVASAPQFQEDPVRVAIHDFLVRQTTGLPGKVDIQVMAPSGGRAPECVDPDPFLPNSANLWGRIAVGVRCGGERPWVRYMQATVTVKSTYYVAARALAPGEPLDPSDLEAREGDLSTLPRSVVTDPAQIVGAVTANRVAAGSPMRMDLVKKAIAVRMGQNVTVSVEGDGFQITSEGKVATDAAIGNTVQVRLKSGQVVNALVRNSDTVVLQQ